MRSCLRCIVTRCLVTVVLAAAASSSFAAQQDSEIRGMTVSTPRGSEVWAGDDMVATIAELKALGVNWIAIHPYGRVSTDGTVSWSWRRRDEAGGEGPDEPPAWIRRPIEEAHRQGMKILVKPHLAYWRDYAWRGDIRYETEAEWDRFFATYTRWIARMASFSRGADAFVVGTELGGTTHHEDRWRQTIDAVRSAYDGPLTYAANWDAYQRVGFWDALDMVGIQAYFPLLDEPPRDGELPSQQQLEEGWRRAMRQVSAFSEAVGRPVVFTETGYNNAPTAAHEPWDYRSQGNSEELQLRCMAAALQAIAAEPTVRGAFLWKWFPGDRLPRDFAMGAPNVREVIQEHWGTGDR